MLHGSRSRAFRQLWMWTTLFVASAAMGAEPMRDADRITQLIRDLASPTFATRELASKELIKIGIAALPELEAAAVGPDAETRSRAKRILVVIGAASLEQKIEAFRKDVDGKQQLTLPGWKAFREQFGGEKSTRELFAEMYKSGPVLLSAIEDGDPRSIADRLRETARELEAGFEHDAISVDDSKALEGLLSAMLWAACRPEVAVDDKTAEKLTQYVNPQTFQPAARASQSVQRELLSEWVQRDSGAAANYNKMMLSLSFELPVTIDLARRVIKSEVLAKQRAFVILLVAKNGNAADLGTIEPTLMDERVIGSPTINKKRIEVQVRDVTLAAIVELTGQDLKKYGFSKSQFGSESGINPFANIFENGAKRDAALKAWREWRAANPAQKLDSAKPVPTGGWQLPAAGPLRPSPETQSRGYDIKGWRVSGVAKSGKSRSGSRNEGFLI